VQVVVTNTIQPPDGISERSRGKVVHLSLAPLIADIIALVQKKSSLPNYYEEQSSGRSE
jgi:phosphoribosylpyrophosphate synthetase